MRKYGYVVQGVVSGEVPPHLCFQRAIETFHHRSFGFITGCEKVNTLTLQDVLEWEQEEFVKRGMAKLA